jgi:Tol biopolymer transport system component
VVSTWFVSGFAFLPVEDGSAAPAAVHGTVGFFLDYARSASADYAVYRMNVDGSGLREILPKGTRTGGLSPDGKRFYYFTISFGSTPHAHIAVSDPNGHHVHQLSSHNDDDYDLGVSPDGKQIAFGHGLKASGNYIEIADANGRHVRRVPHTEEGTVPRFFPNERYLTFERSAADPCCPLYIIRADGRGKRAVAGGRLGDAPAISPDGRTLVFSLTHGKTFAPGATDQLAVQSARGGAVRRLTAAGNCIRTPQWAPDGAAIFFIRCVRQRGGDFKFGSMSIAEINPDGTGLRTLVSHLGSASLLVPIPAPPAPTRAKPSASPTVSPQAAATAMRKGHDTSRTGPVAIAFVLVALVEAGNGYALLHRH